MKFERGGFAIGLVAGLLIGLALALAVALYITKVPVPFVNKVPQRTAEQDRAEAERNKNWNPNAPLAPNATRPLPPVAGPSSAPVPGAARDPGAILSGAAAPPPVSTGTPPEPFTYLVQVGAYTRPEDAEAERAKLAMRGLQARVSEREQAGRTVYRVRVGPFDRKAEADAAQKRLKDEGIDGQLVRIQRP